MKKIKDAVIDLGGKLPKINNTVNAYSVHGKNLFYREISFIGTDDQFEAEAKRLGYINGYRWGVEYPTNGKRPDLPDDVEVERRLIEGWTQTPCPMGNFMVWTEVKSFRITDQRYKPVDEVSDNSKSNDFEMNDNSWHERGELPPVGVIAFLKSVGVDVEVIQYEKHNINAAGFPEIHDVAIFKYRTSCGNLHVGYSRIASDFRPIKTHREKVIEAAVKVCTGVNIATSADGLTMKTLSKLFDVGMLVLPQDSSDTKD